MARRLASMRVTEGFKAFILDQLEGIESLRARSMFGGVGLYAEDLFFGILASDTLYFKVDDQNRPAFQRAGAAPFKPYPDRPMSMSYYQVPAEVIEDQDELTIWAEHAIAAARRAGGRRRRKG